MEHKGSLTKILVELAKVKEGDSSKLESSLSDFREFYSKHDSHYYAEISNIVFFQFEENQPLDTIDQNLTTMIDFVKNTMSSFDDDFRFSTFSQRTKLILSKDEKLIYNLLKIQDHIQLCLVQKKAIEGYQRAMIGQLLVAKKDLRTANEKTKDLEEIISDQTDKADKADKAIAEYDNKVSTYEKKISDFENNLKQTSSRIYAEFIVILGIFTTIIFATFGGLEISSNIFSNLNDVSTGKLMVFGSFIVATIILILFMLLNGISKLTKFRISSCGCNYEDNCNHNSFQKYPYLIIANMALLFVFMLGITQYFIPYEVLLKKIFIEFEFSLTTLPILIICLFLIIVLVVLYKLFRKNYLNNEEISEQANNNDEQIS